MYNNYRIIKRNEKYVVQQDTPHINHYNLIQQSPFGKSWSDMRICDTLSEARDFRKRVAHGLQGNEEFIE